MGSNIKLPHLASATHLRPTPRNRGNLPDLGSPLSFAKLLFISLLLAGDWIVPPAAHGAATSLTLLWQGVAGADGYKVERAPAATGPWSQIGQTISNVTTFTNTGLTPGTMYYYRVRSFNEFGDSDPSETVAGMTSPAAPSNLTATAASASQINLTWQNNTTGQTAVKVERATAATGPWSQIALLAGTATSFSNTGLAALTTYYYRIRASNAGGDSAYSSTANATTHALPDTTAPTTPTGLVATGIATNQVRLTWNASTDTGGSGLAGYRVYRSGSLITTTTANTFTDTGRAPATQYCYTVAAYDNAGNSSASSATVCATTLAPPVVVPVAGLYGGLVLHPTHPTHADSGTIAVSVRTDGSYTASMGLGGVKHWFSSQFNQQGTTSATIPRTGLPTLTVNLTMRSADGEITGTVADGARTVQVLAPRRYWSRSLPCPWAGSYRVKFAPPDAGPAERPEGSGYGTLLVRADGWATFSGYLADGTRVISGGAVTERGHFPLYALLYRRGGACVSWLTLQAGGAVTGVLDWFRPAATSGYYTNGFTVTCDVTGGHNTAALNMTAGAATTALELVLGGSEFASGIAQRFHEDAQGRITAVPVAGRSAEMRLNRRSGEFHGLLRPDSAGPLLRFRGMLDLSGATGDGFHLGPTKTGYAHVSAVP